MATLQQLIEKFEEAANGLRAHVETNIILTANNGITEVVGRLVNTGKDENGNPFKDYTPEYKLWKAGLTKKKIARANKKINKALESGSDFSPKTLDTAVGIRGRYKGYVDFQLTGEMLNNLQIIAKETTSGAVKVSIGNTRQNNIDKMEGNIKTRGKFIAFSKKEEKDLTADFNTRFEEFINRIFAE